MFRNTLITFAALILSIEFANAQAVKIGKIDNDGKILMLIDNSQGKELIHQFAAFEGLNDMNALEISLSEMPLGEVCLTGYQTGTDGKIIKGFRIMCSQDDENNLIVKKGNRTEIINGKSF